MISQLVYFVSLVVVAVATHLLSYRAGLQEGARLEFHRRGNDKPLTIEENNDEK